MLGYNHTFAGFMNLNSNLEGPDLSFRSFLYRTFTFPISLSSNPVIKNQTWLILSIPEWEMIGLKQKKEGGVVHSCVGC